MKGQNLNLQLVGTTTGYHCAVCNTKLASNKLSHIQDHNLSAKHLKQGRYAGLPNVKNNADSLSVPVQEQDFPAEIRTIGGTKNQQSQKSGTESTNQLVILTDQQNTPFFGNHTQFQESNGPFQQKSFTSTYATDWENLSRACSSMSQMSEAAKLLFQEKDKQLFEKDKTINKLEEKLEVKDRELIHLRSQIGGLEIQEAKVNLAQVGVRLEEREKELNAIKLQADKQGIEWELKENKWLNKEKEWLKMFGQVYNLSKDPDFYKDLKKALEGFQESLHNSKRNSPKNSNFCSQDGNSSPIKMEEEGPVDLHINGHQYQGDSMPIHRIDCKNMREVFKDVQKGQYMFENNLTKRTLGIRKHAKRPQLDKIKTSNANQTHLNQEKIETILQQKKSKTPLEQRRDAQRTRIKDQFKSHKSQLMTVERWLLKLKQYQPNGFQLTKLGSSICDAIILPMCPLIFGEDKKQHDSKMKVFLLSQKIPVQNICESQRKNDRCVLVQLTDAKNAFTLELIQNLGIAMDTLRNNVSQIVLEPMLTEQQKQQEHDNIYVRQIDYTQDLNGFFMSLSVRTDLNNLGNLLNIGHKNEYNQLNTLFQFTKAEGSHLVSRTKIYNKMVHLMTCHQFKKWMSMGLRKVFKASSDFYLDKIQPSIDSGLTRIEKSLYFRSIADWETLQTIDSVDQAITKTLEALNQMKDKLVYKVSFNVLWESFWSTIDENKTMIAFESDAWAVCYGYCNRSYLYTGYDVDKTNHSGTMLNFLKRYAGKQTVVFIKDKEFLITKLDGARQIPIDSLNVIQSKSYEFGVNNEEFCYHLSQQQLNLISFTCDDPEFYAMFGEEFDQHHLGKCVDFGEFETNNEIQIEEVDENLLYEHQQRKRGGKFDNKEEVKAMKLFISCEERSKSRKREANQKINYSGRGINVSSNTQERQNGCHQLKKNGSKNGKKLWQCIKCKKTYRTENDSPPTDNSGCVC